MKKLRLIDVISRLNVDYITSTDADKLDMSQAPVMWNRFYYKAIYIPTGVVIKDYVFVQDRLDGFKLVNEWNRRSSNQNPIGWLYVAI